MSLGPMGMNTGMDINSMVSKMVDAERVPKQQRIDNERADNETSISAYGRLKESLDTMKYLMADFRQERAYAARAVGSTDDGLVSATATTEAIAGRYSVDVLQLAQGHKLASGVFAEDEEFGPGELQIKLGRRSFTLDVKENSKLSDIVRGINDEKANPGVRASVINDVDGPRLILASDQTGEKHAISIVVKSQGADSGLKQLEYKTLEQRVRDLEQARAAAQELISPLSPEQKLAAQQVADTLIDAAKTVDAQVAEETAAAQSDPNVARDSADLDSAAAVKAAEQTSVYQRPQDRIPGWSEAASGTLLDSYYEPKPELDAKARAKSKQVPGWSNTASGTLTDSYVTPAEAQDKLDKQLAAEKAAIAAALASGEITEEEAKQAERAKLSEEERAHLEEVDRVNDELLAAQQAFDAYSGLTQVEAAQDAKVMLDGIAQVSSSNNVIENAIDGVNLTLLNTSEPGERPAEVSVDYDRDRVRDQIEQFVHAYNQFHFVSKDLASVDPVTGRAGPLAGDSLVRSAESRLKGVFTTRVEGAPADMGTLSSFGITTTREGHLEINHQTLNRQLEGNFHQLESFFGGNNGFARKVEDAIHSLTGPTGTIRSREHGIVERNHRLRDDQAALDRRMESLQKRTHDRFAAMQDATSNMQAQLSGMMNVLG
ncbi:flagellar filament capping protein FliD [Vibrio sp. WXL103]|uniref:flagellar filament capping protein FliD n=1 Tax=unclassified Vibrio TaxID=2614977 RepID=UPI003EC5BBB8